MNAAQHETMNHAVQSWGTQQDNATALTLALRAHVAELVRYNRDIRGLTNHQAHRETRETVRLQLDTLLIEALNAAH